MKEEAYNRYLKAHQQRMSSTSAYSIPGWVGGLKYHYKNEDGATYGTEKKDSDYETAAKTIANSVVSSIDEWWRYYVRRNSNSETQEEETSESNEKPQSFIGQDLSEDPLWALAEIEGDLAWLDWLDTHIWTYVGLSAPLLGAMGPLRGKFGLLTIELRTVLED